MLVRYKPYPRTDRALAMHQLDPPSATARGSHAGKARAAMCLPNRTLRQAWKDRDAKKIEIVGRDVGWGG